MSTNNNIYLNAKPAASYSWNLSKNSSGPIKYLKTVIAYAAGALGLYKVTVTDAQNYLFTVDTQNDSGTYNTKAGKDLFKQLEQREISVLPQNQVVGQTNRVSKDSVDGGILASGRRNTVKPHPVKQPVSYDFPDMVEPAPYIRPTLPIPAVKKPVTNRAEQQPPITGNKPETAIPASTKKAGSQSNKGIGSDSAATGKLQLAPKSLKPKARERKNTPIIQSVQPLGVPVIRQAIDQLLAGIDHEIDQITIPDFLSNHNELRTSLKSPFEKYRKQLKSYTNPTAEVLNNDLNHLQIMQRTMYAAVRSPQAYEKLEELPCKGIVNGLMNCYYISRTQNEIHNQFYMFYVFSYGLLGKKSLSAMKYRNTDDEFQEELKKSPQRLKLYNRYNLADRTLNKECKNRFPGDEPFDDDYTFWPDGTLRTPGSRIVETPAQFLHDNEEAYEQMKRDVQSDIRECMVNKQAPIAQIWYQFYLQYRSKNHAGPLNLPYAHETDGSKYKRFPCEVFDIPYQLYSHPAQVESDKPTLENLKTTVNEVAFCIDHISYHHWALVKRKDGSIWVLDDMAVSRKYDDIDAMINDFSEYNHNYHLLCESKYLLGGRRKKHNEAQKT
ncbi:MAG: hypothetical protein ACPGEF_03880 [Endozoicomonas sp.]